MIYEKRNLDNIKKLAPNTRQKALEWYEYCKENKIEILIYETIRTLEQQRKNVANKKSKTMRSYHLVGQALDFVPVDSKGSCLWSIKDYTQPKIIQAINYAKKLGFTWGGDWDNDGQWTDETFLDSPHIQYTYKGYGTDKALDNDNGDDFITDAKVTLNDNKSISAIIKDGRTYVQVRDIADLLGLKIVYNNDSKTTKLYTK